MTDRTPEKDAADAVLDGAIQQWAEAYDLVEPGDVITEYVIGLAAQSPAKAARCARYAWGSRHDAMPLHHIHGLLDVVRDAVDANTSDEDGDGWVEP